VIKLSVAQQDWPIHRLIRPPLITSRGIEIKRNRIEPMNQCEAGRMAEQLVARYLRSRGYTIWKTNWRWGKRELDLVTLYRDELVIVEVKARLGNAVNDPAEVVDGVKQRNIVLATDAFIRLYDCRRPTRFDVIAVVYRPEGIEIEHIENAFFPAVE
jgi:putative endonuclease